ncbi:MAG: AAA family ATPase [Deltaproteobacteria bacterium]|jgi:AAA15 family ATPase/GTPase|nr:AAA family ATPase [Deltaproteobacteria bacterium]
MINAITINNFRRFNNLSLETVTPIVLISGKNNIGKSSFLESIYLSCRYFLPTVFIELNNFRGIYNASYTKKLLWEQLFRNFNLNDQIKIETKFDNSVHSLTIKKNEDFTAKFKDNTENNVVFKFENDYVLDVSNITTEENKFIGSYFVNNNNISLKTEGSTITNVQNIFLISDKFLIYPNAIAEQFSAVELAGKKDEIISILNHLNNKINNIFLVMTNNIPTIYVSTTDNIQFPINSMGSGINKLFIIILYAIANPNSIIIIDELENGFYYSFFEQLWKVIFELTSRHKLQIIATTHSHECIHGAVKICTKNNYYDIFTFLRLSFRENNIVPILFSEENLKFAIESNFEIR